MIASTREVALDRRAPDRLNHEPWAAKSRTQLIHLTARVLRRFLIRSRGS